MPYLNLLLTALKLLSAFAAWLHDRGLIAEGEARAVAAGESATLAELRRVADVRAAADADHAAGKLDTTFERD